MSEKPVFRHWLHREYWDTIARHFEEFWYDMDKVLLLLRIKYRLYDSHEIYRIEEYPGQFE